MKTVYLQDFKNEVKQMINSLEHSNIDEAIDLLIHYGLRYNIRTGKTLDSKGVIAEYSNKLDIPKNPTITDILQYEILPLVMNECKRIDLFQQQGKSYYY